MPDSTRDDYGRVQVFKVQGGEGSANWRTRNTAGPKTQWLSEFLLSLWSSIAQKTRTTIPNKIYPAINICFSIGASPSIHSTSKVVRQKCFV